MGDGKRLKELIDRKGITVRNLAQLDLIDGLLRAYGTLDEK